MSRESEISYLLSTSIDRELIGLPNTASTTSNEQYIYKVHDELRSHSKEAYEPKVLSIGPYHHGKPKLEKMEMHKQWYLQELLDRRGETSRDRYIVALTENEDRARKYYAEEEISQISQKDFVKMMFLDGCFVIEFLRKLCDPRLRNRDDTIFKMGWLLNCIQIDLILFENQVPFFIQEQLFDTTKLPSKKGNLKDLVFLLGESLIYDCRPKRMFPEISAADKITHLLELVHKSLCSSFAKTNYCRGIDISLEFIKVKPTSELKLSGIEFEAASLNQPRLDITFENGKLKMPRLTVEDHTESVFRNLIAYEQYMLNSESWRCVSDYINFLDLLIDSPKDVEILRNRQIIRNLLGDDEAVSTMFNKLGHDVKINHFNFGYSRVFEDMNEYSIKRRNIWRGHWNDWMDHLMRNYFHTPWSIISFLAALVLLILTSVQTIFSILQYTNQ